MKRSNSDLGQLSKENQRTLSDLDKQLKNINEKENSRSFIEKENSRNTNSHKQNQFEDEKQKQKILIMDEDTQEDTTNKWYIHSQNSGSSNGMRKRNNKERIEKIEMK